jgi:hypothetical protein
VETFYCLLTLFIVWTLLVFGLGIAYGQDRAYRERNLTRTAMRERIKADRRSRELHRQAVRPRYHHKWQDLVIDHQEDHHQ